MRIVLVTETFTPAGDAAAETSRQVCDALLAQGHELLVVTGSPGKGSYRRAEVWRVRRAPSAAALRLRVGGFAPDVVHVLRPRGLGAAVLRALEDHALPTVVVDPTPFTPRVGTVLATSRPAAHLLTMVGVEPRLWTPGVRSDEHHPGLRSAALNRAWSRGSALVAGYAGPVGEPTSKHVRRLARDAALEEVRLVVLGSGPGAAALKRSGARVVGACGGLELARALASLDVLVQPRKHESGLLAVRKALASGVPVVAFDTAAVREVVRHGYNGLLVPPGRGRNGIAEAVALLAADRALRDRLATRARDSVAGRTWADAVVDLVAASGAAQPARGVVTGASATGSRWS